MAKQTIDPKRPPLQWDTVNDAFTQINDNFTELYLSIGNGSAVDLTQLGSNINPANSLTYDLGTPSQRWRRLYLGGGALYVDNAVITATGTRLELPFGATVGGALIKDPAEGSFRNISVPGQSLVSAEDLKDTLNIIGSGIDIITNPGTDTIRFSNAGVTAASAGTGIRVSAATGNITITNTGVTGITAGTGISATAGTGSITISNTGVTRIVAGSNIVLDNSTGVVTITNGSPNILQNLWRFISIAGQDNLDPISANDTLRFAGGPGVTLTTNTATNTVTISVSERKDIIGSIFADDSTMLIDGVAGRIVGPVFSNVTGNLTGNVTGNLTGNVTGNLTGNVTGGLIGYHTGDVKGSVFGQDSTMLIDGTGSRIIGPVATSSLRTSETKIALGYSAGETSQGNASTAIGAFAGQTTQGANAVAVGFNAGQTAQGANALAIGLAAGFINQGLEAVAVGLGAGHSGQGISAVAIGNVAGYTNQGLNAIAIGKAAGATNQAANSIVINASGIALDGIAAGLYVRPVREIIGPQTLYYNPTTYEVTWGPVPAGGGGGGGSDFELNVAADDSTIRRIFNGETLKFVGANGITTATDGEGKLTISGPSTFTGNIFTSLIDSADSTAITVTPSTIFSSDVTVENELTVSNKVTAKEFISTGTGDPTLESTGDINLTAAGAVKITASPLRFASFTSAQRNLLTPSNGDVIYNTTTGKFQGRAAGVWVDLH